MTWDEVSAIAHEWPGVEGGTYHGYPALRVAGKFLTRLGDDRAGLEFKAVGADRREMMIAAQPDLFFLPPGFHGQGVFAPALDEPALRGLIETLWLCVAPKALVRSRL